MTSPPFRGTDAGNFAAASVIPAGRGGRSSDLPVSPSNSLWVLVKYLIFDLRICPKPGKSFGRKVVKCKAPGKMEPGEN